ncbi:MAG: hypothetical protein P8181_16855, partial [bacterium]
VLEWSRDGLRIVRRTGSYQISTNFVSSNFEPAEYPCKRYKIADEILGSSDGEVSVKLVRSVLSATCFEYFTFSPTVYSVIVDLVTGRMYISFFHNFEDVVELDLREELRKGEARYRLQDVFTIHSFAYSMFLDKMEHLVEP